MEWPRRDGGVRRVKAWRFVRVEKMAGQSSALEREGEWSKTMPVDAWQGGPEVGRLTMSCLHRGLMFWSAGHC